MNPIRAKKALTFIILPVVFLSILSISYFHLMDNYELKTLDFRYSLRSHIPTTDKVVLVEIGEDSIEKLGRFPFARTYHALLIKALSESGAKAIVFDIFFSEPEKGDQELEDIMRKAGNVYLPYVFNIDTKPLLNVPTASGYIARNLERFNSVTKAEGHINISPDIDGKYRRVPLYVKYNGSFYPYLSFLMGCDYLGIKEKDVRIVPGRYVACGPDMKIPLDEHSNMIINFTGGWAQVYKHYSYIDILQSYLTGISGQKPILDLSAFKDKVCIVGLTAAGTVDLHPTPFETLYPGMGVHAEIFNSMVNRTFITRASRAWNILILITLGLLVSLLTMKLRPLKALFMLVTIIFFFVYAAIALFNLLGVWVDLLYPVLIASLSYISLTLYKYVGEWKKRLLMDNELAIAKKIQQSFLPKRLPAHSGVEIAADMFTARQVGGDLYDFIEFDSDRLGVMIGDVSGKGVPASLFMAMVTGEFKFFVKPDSKPQETLFNLNSTLVRESPSTLFVTMFYGILDLKNKVMAYANGGHLPLIYAGPDKGLKFLDVDEGTPLGLMEGPYTGGAVTFDKDDVFVFYTDGITEAMNEKAQMYGTERLASLVESNKNLSSRDLLDAIEKDVRKFEPASKQHDDMTLIVIKII